MNTYTYTKENFIQFMESSDSRGYLITDFGSIECIKHKFTDYIDYNIVLLNTPSFRGYKAFNTDWTCRDKQYAVGGVFKENIDMPIPCESGMHFCKDLVDVFYYYKYDLLETRVAEVEATGAITTRDGEKFCTNELKVIRELYPYEILDAIRSAIYRELMLKLPSPIVHEAMVKLRMGDEDILKNCREGNKNG